jgi:hypothetical protein
MRHKALQVMAVIAVGCAMVVGLTYVLQRHAQEAESYPQFSSFRTLPEGTSIIYDALGRTSGMVTERNTQPLGAMRSDNAAILMLGIQPLSVYGNAAWFSDMESLAQKGNRVIVGLLPRRYRFLQPDQEQLTNALRRWSISLAYVKDIDIRDEEEDALTAGWPMYFAKSDGWGPIRKESDRAVVVERKMGKGSIVLLANAYLFSNAAMVDDRQTEFVADLIGPVHRAIFDETHFGIEQTGSIAGLARRYRLQGLVLGLIITAALFIWKSAAGFPPAIGRQTAPSLLGEDSSASFLNLLRRNIRTEDILATCVESWRKMYERKADANVSAAIDLAEGGRKTPSRTYAEIQKVLGAKRDRS